MKNKDVKKMIISALEDSGIDFNKSPFELNGGEKELLRNFAEQIGYKRSKTSYFSTGGSFFEHLKKIKNNEK